MSEQKQGIISCNGICWLVGALIGLIAAIVITGVWGLIVGIALAIAMALVLQRLFCRAARAGGAAALAGGAVGHAATTADVTAEADAADRAAAEAAAAEQAAAERAAAEAQAAEAARQAAAQEAAEKEAAEKAAAAAAVAATPDYDGDGVSEGAGEGSRPEALAAARGGQADDLKLIKGVGPKLEALCNELGFYHFDQIANWTADEVAWVDANLTGFKGRVSRDNWVEQAKVLAAGGTTEFAERAEKSGLYDKN